MHITRDDDAEFRSAIARTLAFRYNVAGALLSVRTLRDLRRARAEFASFRRSRLAHARPLLKDPIALFSAEWLADTFGMDVVVLIRHPAGFASSLKRLDWRFPFSELLSQERLMQNRLAAFADDVRRFATIEQDIVDQAALVWNLTHHMIAEYRRLRPEWLFVRHEDVAREPKQTFEMLFARLGVDFDEDARRRIEEWSDPENPVDAPPGAIHFLKRDSRSVVQSWKRHLSPEEISRIRRRVHPLSDEFYRADDW